MRLAPSPAAQFQATKTRAVLGAQLFFQAMLTILALWIGLVTALVWHQVGLYLPQLDHVYFGRWMVCSILGDTPFLNHFTWWIGIPFNGDHLRLDAASAWLNGPAWYRHSFYEAFYHAATNGWGLAVDLIPIGFLGLLIGWRLRQHPSRGDHLRGLQLLTPREHNRQLHGGAIRRLLYGQPAGLLLGKTVIPHSYECEHFLITGNPGSGKSTTIRSMLRQIAAWSQSAIVIDPEGEYVLEFYSAERGDWILNPLDARCPYWSPWSELRDESFAVDAAAMAASLIRGRPRNESERFFQDSTRTVVEAILHVARDNPDPAALMNLVSLPREQLHAALRGTPAYALIDPQAHDQGAGILGTATNAIKTFVHLPKREQASRTWSARQWAQDRRGWIFLPSQEDIGEAIRTLQGLWLDCLIRWLMTAQIGSDQTWVMADELASLGHQPQIEKLLTRGRKRGLAVVIGLQNVSQLQAIYGREGCITLTSSPSTKIILRVDETETAKWASELIGSHEIERLTMTQLAGLSTYREGVNLQPHRSIEPLVLPDEIKLLHPFTGYLCLAGHHRTTVRIPELYLTRRQPVFIPRAAGKPLPPSSPEPGEAEIAAQITARAARQVEL
ncbi:MAG: type IV secretion system DNA-binding domain-containing protein [Deltaproteobacteria bacterium]|nr:type IV secretion system DNA-binding domain-containing protein [Deltaproteobacteria bacterium]